MNLLKIIMDVAVVVAEVAATAREVGELPRGAISKIIMNGTPGSKNLPASSVAVAVKDTLLATATVMFGATTAELTIMDHVRANGYRKQGTMAWSFHIPQGRPLKNVWQFHQLPHMDFLRV